MCRKIALLTLSVATICTFPLIAVGQKKEPRLEREEVPSHEASKPSSVNPGPDAADSKSSRKGGEKSSEDEKKTRKPLEVTTFGGGCFWSIEAVFERVPGVQSVVSGFAGGSVPHPSYQMVCTGMTGHAEVVQITFDPNIISYEQLLGVFWKVHNPTTPNAQGDDFGPQYRSIILYDSTEQRDAARKVYGELKAKRVYRVPIVTELVPLKSFYPAESYHQDYFRNNPYSTYSQAYIVPKLRKYKFKPPASKAPNAHATSS